MYYYDQPAHWELVRQSNSLAETSNNGDFFEVSLKPEYITTLLKETKMEASNPASTPGTATLKQSTNDEAPLDAQEHADYRREGFQTW